MSYELAFKVSALKEWNKLGHTLREQFKRKLAERLKNPHVPAAALPRATNLYKIKLRQAGYRLVYSVEDQTITVTVIAVGKRDRNAVYDMAMSRLHDPASS
jgi:mRNA interferase RelE/StbE